MKDSNVKLVIEYIRAKPEYKDELDRIKADVLTRGFTEEEFEDAIKQLAIPQTLIQELTEEEIKKELQKEKLKAEEAEITDLKKELVLEKGKKTKTSNKPFAFNPFVEIEIISHVVVIILFMAVGAFILFTPTVSQTILSFSGIKRPQAATTIASIKQPQIQPEGQQGPLSQILVPPVYANGQVIDADRVFSFPPSNVTLSFTGTPKKEIFGFFPYWMLGKAESISLTAITTLSLFGLEVDKKGNIITAYPDGAIDGGWNMWNDPKLPPFLDKLRKKRIKTQITIKAFNNSNIEYLVVSDEGQKTFISNVLHLINSKNLDGINLDFEYVGTPAKTTKDGFTRLVSNLYEEMQRQTPNAELTICTYIVSASNNTIFDVQALADYSDALVIMGYDIHTPGGNAGAVAPMFGEGFNIVGLMQGYLEKVAPEKLILAVPYYGYDWPVISQNDKTQAVDRANILSYAELADVSSKGRILWNETTQTPWYNYIDPLTNLTHEVHFENTRSLGIKYDFVNKKNLKGVGIWALGYDGLKTELQALLIEKFAN